MGCCYCCDVAATLPANFPARSEEFFVIRTPKFAGCKYTLTVSRRTYDTLAPVPVCKERVLCAVGEQEGKIRRLKTYFRYLRIPLCGIIISGVPGHPVSETAGVGVHTNTESLWVDVCRVPREHISVHPRSLPTLFGSLCAHGMHFRHSPSVLGRCYKPHLQSGIPPVPCARVPDCLNMVQNCLAISPRLPSGYSLHAFRQPSLGREGNTNSFHPFDPMCSLRHCVRAPFLCR